MKRRKMTAAEKANRKHDRKALRMTAHQAKQYGPLFSHMAPTFTRDDAYWHNRYQKARAAENWTLAEQANRGLERIRTAAIVRTIIERYPNQAAQIVDYVTRTYPEAYAGGAYRQIITGQHKAGLTLTRHQDQARANQFNPQGFYLIESDHFPPAGLEAMTAAEFDTLFPALDHADGQDGQEPDDNGLFERTIGRLVSGQQITTTTPEE